MFKYGVRKGPKDGHPVFCERKKKNSLSSFATWTADRLPYQCEGCQFNSQEVEAS